MPRKKIQVEGEYTFYVPSGYIPRIIDFVNNTSIITDKRLYLVKILAFTDHLYIRVKHAKKKKARLSVKNIHDLLGMNNSDCSKLLDLLQQHKIIFCDRSSYVTGVIPFSYGFEPLETVQKGFDRVSIRKKDIRRSTLNKLVNSYKCDDADLQLYFDEVISKLELTGIHMEDFAFSAGYNDILGKNDLDITIEKKNKQSPTISCIQYSGDFVPKTEKTDNSSFPYQNKDGDFVPNLIEHKKGLLYSGDFVHGDLIRVTKITDEKLLPLFRIYDKRFFCRPSKKYPDGRVYTNVTNLPKEYRKYLSIDGKRFIGIDIKNSQPLLAAILFMNYSKNKYGEIKADVAAYKEQCEAGQVYEYFMDLNNVDHDKRKEFKHQFFGECFYSRNAAVDKRKLLSFQFEEKYPTCYEALVAYKGGKDYSPRYIDVPITLQAIEKTIIYGTNIEMIKQGIKCFNIFDSLYCTSMEDKNKIEKMLEEKFAAWDLRVPFKTEDHTKDIDGGILDIQDQDEKPKEYTCQADREMEDREYEIDDLTDELIWSHLHKDYWHLGAQGRKDKIDETRKGLIEQYYTETLTDTSGVTDGNGAGDKEDFNDIVQIQQAQADLGYKSSHDSTIEELTEEEEQDRINAGFDGFSEFEKESWRESEQRCRLRRKDEADKEFIRQAYLNEPWEKKRQRFNGGR